MRNAYANRGMAGMTTRGQREVECGVEMLFPPGGESISTPQSISRCLRVAIPAKPLVSVGVPHPNPDVLLCGVEHRRDENLYIFRFCTCTEKKVPRMGTFGPQMPSFGPEMLRKVLFSCFLSAFFLFRMYRFPCTDFVQKKS